MNIILIPTYAGEIWRQFDVAGFPNNLTKEVFFRFEVSDTQLKNMHVRITFYLTSSTFMYTCICNNSIFSTFHFLPTMIVIQIQKPMVKSLICFSFCSKVHIVFGLHCHSSNQIGNIIPR